MRHIYLLPYIPTYTPSKSVCRNTSSQAILDKFVDFTNYKEKQRLKGEDSEQWVAILYIKNSEECFLAICFMTCKLI